MNRAPVNCPPREHFIPQRNDQSVANKPSQIDINVALLAKSECYLQWGEPQLALRLLRRLWMHTRDPQCLPALGEAFLRVNKVRQARKILELSFAFSPSPRTACLLMVTLARQGDWQMERAVWEWTLETLGSQLPPEPW